MAGVLLAMAMAALGAAGMGTTESRTGAVERRAPAGTRPAVRRPGAESVLPNGRIVAPLGRQHSVGTSPFALAVSPNGRMVATSDGSPRFAVTVLSAVRTQWQANRHFAYSKEHPGDGEDEDWRSVAPGIAFETDRALWASEGNSGRVRLMNAASGAKIQTIDLDQRGYKDSYSGDLAYDRTRRLLYVVDQANFRVAVIDARARKLISSVRTGRLPFAIAIAPDGQRIYVTNVGMFEYKAVPGADPKRAVETGLPFPAFGFPSPEAAVGARRETAAGSVDVPGLGDPNVMEANSVAVIDVRDPAAPRVEKFARTGMPFGKESLGGSSPSGVVASRDHIYVSNGHNDSISVIDSKTLEVTATVPLRIPGLENLRGVLPVGLALDEASGWLLVAEAGINAIGVVDTKTARAIGHLPAGWFPVRLSIDRDKVYVVNVRGAGTGPNASRALAIEKSFQADLRRGSVSVFPLPDASELARHTARVMELNGFTPSKQPPGKLPEGIRHVVIIVKENRTFDEVFGDIDSASNGAVNGAPALARFGRFASVFPDRDNFTQRFSLRKVNVTPNHHAMAERWSFSDNFYADSEVSVDGHHWLVGSYPNAWTESTRMSGGQKDFRLGSAPGRLIFPQSNSSVHPEEQLEAGALWHHLERNGVTFRNFGEGFELAGVDEGKALMPTGARFLTNVPMPDPLYRNTSRDYAQYNMNIPDQYRATQFIREIEERYVKPGQELPRLLFIHLPNDHIAKPRPEDGYPFAASYVADNDYALGRMVEYLSHTKWWREMAVFITEDDAQGGVDHIDSHRTVLLVAGPYAKRNYVSHTHSSFPGLLKTAFRLLGLPPLNLFDAAASDLSDCFTSTPDNTPYEVQPVTPQLFDPARAKDPADPQPQPPMDDPRALRDQHRK